MSQTQNNSIEFQSAMENFNVMFPMMDSDVIEEILRINNGNIDKTVETLLSLSNDITSEQLTSSQEDKTKSSVNSESKLRNWNPVLLKDLDQNFLRITHDSEYCDEFAVMLQNEEFLAELRFNQEFLSTLDKEQGRIDKPLEERLKLMGKVSRKKFQQLAKIFTFQKRKKNSSQKPKSKLLDEEDDDESKK